MMDLVATTCGSRVGRRIGPAAAVLAALVARPAPAAAQACCAGAAALTPGRLAAHEDALVGLQFRSANVFGSFRSDAAYVSARATEWNFEQDAFGAVRVAPRAQLALLVPLVETYRRAQGASDAGAGLGDVNLSGRYEFVLAGESRYVPGIAALAGVTFPTGKAIESSDAAQHPLAADATGTGRFQANLGLAIEQTTGPWLFGVSGLYAQRASRTVNGTTVSLGAQWTALLGAAYTFPNDAALALLVSYSVEGNTEENGVEKATSRRRMPQLTLAGLVPVTDAWRLQGGLFFAPPVSSLGRNTPANVGLVLAVIRSWS